MRTKWYKVVAWIFIAVVVLFFLFALWYKYRYSMEPVEPHTINSETFDKKLLIAAQGSTFKDALVKNVIDHYKNDSVFIKVIDVADLSNVNDSDYNALLLLHTWEYGRPPESVETFIKEHNAHIDKIVVVTTSGEGSNRMEGIDGLAGESIIANMPRYTDWVIMKLDLLLSQRK